MPRFGLRLSRPLYEGLPWVYLAVGAAALVGSYLAPSTARSVTLGLVGLLSLIAGIVLLLRRRDYRELRAQYGDRDSPSDLDEK